MTMYNQYFNLPETDRQSCDGARRAFRRAFDWDWPLDDDVLRELARLVPKKSSHPGFSRCDYLLRLMCREVNR